jgi:hypothetical protein
MVNQSEVILQVGAEGGAITLYGIREGSGWRYSPLVIDQTPSLLDEPEIRRESAVVQSWQAALRLVDEYPWHRLAPLTVHPEFRERIWAAVQQRFRNASDRGHHERWRKLCVQPPTSHEASVENG